MPKNTTIKTKQQNNKAYFRADNIVIYKDDILKFNTLPNNYVDLIITSPPYNVDIAYSAHTDNLSYKDYLEFTKKWIKKCFNLTKNEGRFLLNIPLDKNKGGQKPVGADITKIAKDVGWKYHSTIIWNEGNISRRTAWGSLTCLVFPSPFVSIKKNRETLLFLTLISTPLSRNSPTFKSLPQPFRKSHLIMDCFTNFSESGFCIFILLTSL